MPASGFILDGYPRTLAQAEHASGWLDERGIREVVIHLAVDYNSNYCPIDGTPSVSSLRNSV